MEVSKLRDLCIALKTQKERLKKISDEKKELDAEYKKMQGEILEHLKQDNLKNFDFGYGKVISAKKFNVKIEDKFEFTEHLKNEGSFDDMYTYNHSIVNSYYKERLEEARDKGNIDFKINGLSEPTVYEYIQLRSK